MEFFKQEKAMENPEKQKTDIKNFLEKESGIIEKGKGFLMDLVPDKCRKEAAAMLAAFSIFASASSVFAEGEKEKKIDLFPKDSISESVKREDIKKTADFESLWKVAGRQQEDNEKMADDFEWKKIADKITIEIGGKIENIPSEPVGEKIKSSQYNDIIKTEFYKNFSVEENNETARTFSDAFYESKDVKSFFEFLNGKKENLNDKQKVLFLKSVGSLLGKTYNYDMLKKGEHIEISDEKIYEALRELYVNGKLSQTGICGNLSVFMEKTAKSFGMEAFLQSGSVNGSNDVFSGVVAEVNGKKQIIFITFWGDAIPTNTLNLEKASGVFERAYKSIATFGSYVGNEKEMQFPIETLAQKEIKKSSGFEKTEEMLGKNLEQGEIIREKGLEININPEVKEIKLSKDNFILAYYNYQNVKNNPYQSLDDLNAFRLALRSKEEMFGVEAGITTVFMNIKDLYGGNVEQNDIMGRLVLEGMDSQELIKGDYGRIVFNIGSTLQAGMRLPMDKDIKFLTIGGMGEIAGGMRLMYFNPNNAGKFFIGADVLDRGQFNDFQNQDLIIKEALRKITIGSSVNVYEATVDLKAAKGLIDWGKSLELSGAIKTSGGIELGGKYKSEKSEYETLKPSSKKIGFEAGWKGPKWGFTISGAQTVEKYNSAEKEKSYDIRVKLNILAF